MDAGGRLTNKSRFAKFKNVPEMLRSFHVFADVKLSEDLNLKTPDLARRPEDGERQPEVALVPQPAELAEYMKGLAERLDSLAGWAQKGADNALNIYNDDGRKTALDLCLVGIEPVSGAKIDQLVANTLRVWEENRDNDYDTSFRSGVMSGNRGALQIIFCDMSTPTTETGPDGKPVWTAYRQIKDQLVAGGIQALLLFFPWPARPGLRPLPWLMNGTPPSKRRWYRNAKTGTPRLPNSSRTWTASPETKTPPLPG